MSQPSVTKVAMRHLALQGPMDCAHAGELGHRLHALMTSLPASTPARDYEEYLTDAAYELIRLSETYEGSRSLGLPRGSSVEDEQELLRDNIKGLILRAIRDWRNYVKYRDAMEESNRLAQDALRLIKNFKGR